MDGKFLIGFIIGFSVDVIGNLLIIPIKKKWQKDCNYDCSKCKVWDCEMHDCMRRKKR